MSADPEPTAVEVIAEAFTWCIHNDYGKPCSACMTDAQAALAALKARGYVVATRDEIRAMTPQQQADLIKGRVEHDDPETGWQSRGARVVGPWREVQP